jgi:MFS family permease
VSVVAQRMTSKYTVLTILFIGWIVDYLDRMVMSVAIPFIGADFHLGAATLGIVLSSFFAGYAVMQIPGGWLSDKFGSRKVMMISIALWSVFTLLTGLAWSLAGLLVIRLLFGIGEGSFPAASSKAIAEYFPQEETARAESTMLSSNALGVAIAPLFAAPLMAAMGWRNMFMVIAVLGLVVAWLIYAYVRPQTNRQRSGSGAKTVKSKMRMRDLMKTPTMWKLVVMWFGLDIVLWGFSSWLPSYLIKVRHLHLISAGIVASLPFFAGTISMLLGGWLMDRVFVGREKYVAIVVELLGAFFLFMMFQTSNITEATLYQILSAFFLYLGFAAIWSLPLKILPVEIMGSAAGMINFGGQVAGFISPMVMGFLISASGGSYSAAFWFLIIAAVVSAITGLTLTNARGRLEAKVAGSAEL